MDANAPNSLASARMRPPGSRALRALFAVLLAGFAAFAALAGTGLASAVARDGAAPRSGRGHATRHRGHALKRRHAARMAARTAPPLVFGIYPGGAAGTVGPSGTTRAEDPIKRLAALEQLRAPGRPFVLHLYAGYTGPSGWSAADQVGQEIAQYTSHGFGVELALTYRPSDGGSAASVAGFVQFVRETVRAFGANPNFVSLQVTNEANLGGAPNASDGYYAGAKDALIQGVIAAHNEAAADGFGQLKVGFNWGYATDPGEAGFWSYLGAHGGSQFAADLDWVGFDAYPGTWGPSLGGHGLGPGTDAMLRDALTRLRSHNLPLAGIPARVPLHVSESGYPTGPGRTPAMQEAALRASVNAISSLRGRFNVSDYRWFDLRDADSSSSSFESQYGLMRDDYTPKPAFSVYRGLIASLSQPRASVAQVRHRRRHKR